jgi:N4-gp56 family major capsid protein
MAGITEFLVGSDNAAAIRTLWTQDLLVRNGERIFWDRFSGPVGSGMPIIVNSDLTVNAGGTVNVDMVTRASGAGVSGTTALSGAEEEATFFQVAVTPVYYRNGFAVHKSQRRKTLHELREWGKNLAVTWSSEHIDNAIFDILDAVTTDLVYGGDATSKATIEAADVLTADLIAKAAAKAKGKFVKPLIIDGQEWYIMIVHPYAAYSLRGDSDWLGAQQYAGARDLTNPIFSGRLGAVHGVMLFESSRVAYGTNAGVGTPGILPYSIGHLVGAEAAAFAWSQQPGMLEEVTDYGTRQGIGVDMMYGCASATFNSVPIGHVPVMVASANPNA